MEESLFNRNINCKTKMARKGIDLTTRVTGPWAPFETEVLAEEHVGWPVPISQDKFRLKISPFHNIRDCIYVLDNKNIEMPQENECIRVEGREDKNPIFKQNSTIGRYEKTMYVEDLKPYKIKRNKPDCSYKDFIYYCTSNWDSASEDDLDKMIALQLVSCPFSIAGHGGLGSITSKITKTGTFGKSYINDLESTFKEIVPSNFYSEHDIYRFSFLKGRSQSLKLPTKRFCELNYVKSCLNIDEALNVTKMPIQIPLLVRDPKLNKKINDYQDLILQYQLTALTYQPKFNDGQLRIFENNIKEIREVKLTEKFLNIDLFAINKLALAFSRLYLSDELDSNNFKTAAELFFKKWDDWSNYLSRQSHLDKYKRNMMANDITINFTSKEMKMYVAIKKIQDETNDSWINVNNLIDCLGDKRVDWIQVLENLINSGLIIYGNNFKRVKLIEYDWDYR
jgi:hypothetical protein